MQTIFMYNITKIINKCLGIIRYVLHPYYFLSNDISVKGSRDVRCGEVKVPQNFSIISKFHSFIFVHRTCIRNIQKLAPYGNFLLYGNVKKFLHIHI